MDRTGFSVPWLLVKPFIQQLTLANIGGCSPGSRSPQADSPSVVKSETAGGGVWPALRGSQRLQRGAVSPQDSSALPCLLPWPVLPQSHHPCAGGVS